MGRLQKTIFSLLFIIAFVWMMMLIIAGPPKPVVLSEGKEVSIVQGSYCWQGFINNRCVDKIPPPEIIANNKIVPFPVSPQSEININFKKAPIEGIEVDKWVGNDEIEVVKVHGNVFTVPKEKGTYIYSVFGSWDKGSSSYIFAIEVK
ncbi:hypothetical protein ABE61_17310 [Lysinibacillus sphaericus]|uniref:hypothetical protein n=1 Tax=Lysinibacillus sphaericus TaxID=1421 RepID=UPI0018CEDFAC|nr:hypothetical protein [Lysinibacillus sphaericus]MBG9455764.1 hypothetical protein [Lysinibacillus sphaericus]MBG9477783.1 hypothetical protein [Lysinibacillus sphaericus]MBG9593242.1 hypothetical protein [Lysinibacillus sphaericus]